MDIEDNEVGFQVWIKRVLPQLLQWHIANHYTADELNLLCTELGLDAGQQAVRAACRPG